VLRAGVLCHRLHVASVRSWGNAQSILVAVFAVSSAVASLGAPGASTADPDDLASRKIPMGRWESRRVFVPAALCCVVLLAAFFLLSASSPRRTYGVMFDAGSTGSRVHVYSFRPNGELADEVFRQIQPGLSAYADPAEAAASLKPLLEVAMQSIPRSQHRCTPLAVKATAGLRQLGKEQAERHLQAVRDLLLVYPFHVESDAVAIMSGTEEAAFAWITINHLLNRLNEDPPTDPDDPPRTAAVMDLGGGSTQIVFETSANAMAAVPGDLKFEVQLGKVKHVLYQHSYEGWGLNAARQKIFAAKVPPEPSALVPHPCIPQGHTEKITLEGKAYTLVPSDDVSFHQCFRIAAKVLRKEAPCEVAPCSFNGVHQPDVNKRNVFKSNWFAISYFYDRTQLLEGPRDLNVGGFKTLAERACQATAANASYGVLCADLTYMYALLSRGYGIQDSSGLDIQKKINGFETGWSLGAMVVLMKKIDLKC